MTRRAAGRSTLVLLVSALAGALLVSSCGRQREDPDALSNAGIRELVRDKWDYQESETARCMKDEGFRYVPVAFDEDKVTMPTGDRREARYLEITLTVEEVKREGFGVTTNLGGFGALEDATDKNSEIAGALSEAEYAAYQLALEGEKGCRPSAEATADQKFAGRERELQSTAESIRTYVFASPKFLTLSATWSRCMERRGWNDASFLEFDADVRFEAQKRMDEIAVGKGSGGESDAPPQIVYPPDELDKVRQYEIGAAVDYVECFETVRSEYNALLQNAYDRLR